jgi:hypothetical protein
MKRRDFLTAAGGTGLATMAAATVQAGAESSKQEFIEIQVFSVKDHEKRAQLIGILDKALVPALNRQGIKPVGVFVPLETETKFGLNVFVVVPHKTTETLVSENAKLLADSAYRKDAAALFETTSKNPVYTDCQTFLLQCFATVPALETPNLGADRVFELRRYRSFSIERNAAKIKMFEHGGELPLFRELGLNPIFFAEMVAGKRLPNLMYMVGFPSMEKHEAVWKEFVAHPKWQTMKSNPEFADTATEIDRVILKPSAGSQI